MTKEAGPAYLDGKLFRGELKRRAERSGEPNQPTVRLALREVMEAVEAAMTAQAAAAEPEEPETVPEPQSKKH
jgi:hypothetical protein